MAETLKFFADLAPLVYALIVIGIGLAARRLYLARQEYSTSIFGLEKRLAGRRSYESIAGIGLLLMLAVTETILVVFLVPNLPAASLLLTPTLDPLATPQNTLPPEALATLGILPIAATPTPGAVGCIPGQIDLTSPTAGQELSGRVTLEGSADVPNFGFYKFEYAPLGTETWSAIQAWREPKRQEELGWWDTSTITPGDYLLRLVVTDNEGNPLAACVVPVRIKVQ
jgi:hypothetical protein